MKKLISLMIVLLMATALFAAFEGVTPPSITSAVPNENNPLAVDVSFTAKTDGKAANKADVVMTNSTGKVVDTKTVGRSRNDAKTVTFNPPSTDTYTFVVKMIKNGVTETLDSESFTIDYKYPLAEPELTVKNIGENKISIEWSPVNEAKSYQVSIDGKVVQDSDATSYTLEGEEGHTYDITIRAVRAEGDTSSTTTKKTAKSAPDREWNFTFFGQSVNEDRNKINILDNDNLTIEMLSCTTTPDGEDIDGKGGKFTAFHDGITYYYTVIDPETENFELTATFYVDFINPIADGQEGFGILAMDSLGEFGVSAVNHYTNSAGVISYKYEETIDGKKNTSKDTLGARFVSGITPEVLAGGDAKIAEEGKSVQHAYSYNSSDLIRKGNSYTITLKMDNTGFHAIWPRPNLDEGSVDEYIMYGKDKLLQLDGDHIYLGLAVARGCNVTVSDIKLTITDPASDPPAEEEPPELLPYAVKVDSPSSWYNTKYPFVFSSNADGKLTITNGDPRNLKTYKLNVKIKANVDYKTTLPIHEGFNDFEAIFTPSEGYEPFEHTRMAKYDSLTKKYVEDYTPITERFSVTYVIKPGEVLYVSPSGSIFGDGSYDNPLDITSAINYSMPGQTIILKNGIYYPTSLLTIERGNSGLEGEPKTLRAENPKEAILDFSNSKAGMQIWGDWWIIDGLVIRRTIGDVKGLQVAGHNNIIRFTEAYECGDTGIQISGTSNEPYSKWPSNNLIYACISHDNRDPAENNADGFAAKITVADGNVFDSCIAYHNIDDGWDLFAKIESGPIGPVVIKNSVAYGNGSLSDGSGNGDGNGFKLGGDGIAVSHQLINSVTFENGAAGVTSNSDPAVELFNVTSYGNKGMNIALYGKGDGARSFKAEGVVSVNGGDADNISEMPELASPLNFFFNGGQSVNSEGVVYAPSNFKSTTFTGFTFLEDGRISLNDGYLEIVSGPTGVGATL